MGIPISSYRDYLSINDNEGISIFIIIGASSGGAVLVIILVLIVFLKRRKRSSRALGSNQNISYQIKSSATKQSNNSAANATEKFDKTAISIPAYLDVNCNTSLKHIKKIGEGGFGEIWYTEAIDLELIKRAGGEFCAVKLFKGIVYLSS